MNTLYQSRLPMYVPREEMKWRWLKQLGVINYAGRDIIQIMLDDGTIQPFYKSSGRNSGQPGKWFPFDGLFPFCYPVQGWFIKDRYGVTRLGSQFYASISEALEYLDIPKGVLVFSGRAGIDYVNKWLGIESMPLAIECQREAA